MGRTSPFCGVLVCVGVFSVFGVFGVCWCVLVCVGVCVGVFSTSNRVPKKTIRFNLG